ncbi:MAG TPA: hypothetical protein VLJ57_04910 [Burkholderiaceae bacterium]|nr:hypothetical protein [Burkholderiaceae bacterium]
MLSENRPHLFHWIGAAAVAAALALSVSEVRGQGGGGAAAAAAGRPAMSGAQGGLGAQPGLQQGGLGTQGEAPAQVEIPLRRHGTGQSESPLVAASGSVAAQLHAEDRKPSDVSPLPKKTDAIKPQRSTTRKAVRATKRSLDRARTGVGEVDAAGGQR